MDLKYSAEDEAFRQEVRDFIDKLRRIFAAM